MTCKTLNRLTNFDKDRVFKARMERSRGHRWNLQKERVRRDVKKYFFSNKMINVMRMLCVQGI